MANTPEKMRIRLARLRERMANDPVRVASRLEQLEAEAADLERQIAEQEG